MQTKRSKRSRIRAAKPTGGKGHKKKNRGAGHRGGRGNAGGGKKGDAKLMKVTKGIRNMGKHGFVSLKKDLKIINLHILQTELDTLVQKGKITKNKDVYDVDISKLGYDKLLSKGHVTVKLNISVKFATENAILRVEQAGGKVTLLAEKPVKKNKKDKQE
ncbi:MAG: uL15m family ribosomal protein [Nanoarchaeota archaeon]